MASPLSSLPLLLFSLYLTSASHEHGTNFTFHGFFPSNFTLDGTANVTSNGLLRLTNNLTAIQTSHAILSNPVHFGAKGDSPPLSFSTNFVFAIVPPYPGLGVFGMAFLIAPRDRINVSTRSPKYLGLFDQHTNGSASNHIVAVEFNLLPDPHLRSFRDNHIDIDVNSVVHVNSTPAGYYTGTKNDKLTKMSLMSGEPIQAWVDYSARDEKLEVTIAPLNVTSRPTRPLCSTHVNLTGVLLEDMHLGFSGSAGRGSVTQYVLGWSFRLNGKADPLDLSKLPKLPQPRVEERRDLHITTFVIMALAIVVVMLVVILATYAYSKRKEKYADVFEERENGRHKPPLVGLPR